MTSATAWRCSVCGYVHRGEEPPDFCPVCGASASEFESYEEPSSKSAVATAERWRCVNCSYIHDGDSAPDSCPICGVGSEEFEPMPEVEEPTDKSGSSIHAVIVGGGIAGVSAAEAIRDASTGSSITLISAENSLPYYRLNLTRYLAGEIDMASLSIHPESWYSDRDVELLLGRNITDLSLETGEVILDDGSRVAYDKLILAMGSHPFVPPLPGADLDGVYTVRTAEDADVILNKLESGAACVCIGGGILGLETAGALAKRGGDVTLLESHEWLMPRQLNREGADLLEAHMTEMGVKLRKSARTAELSGSDGSISEVVLDDGTRIPCGMVVVCTGVRPNTYLARKAGLEVNRGIVVDNHLRTSSPDIFAAGDVTEHNGTIYGVWGPSQFQGAIAGLNALGVDTPFGGLPRSNALKVLGVDMLSIGQFTPDDGSYQVVQESKDKEFYHFVFRDGKMVGCILLGDTESAASVKQAIESGKDFSGVFAGSPAVADILESL